MGGREANFDLAKKKKLQHIPSFEKTNTSVIDLVIHIFCFTKGRVQDVKWDSYIKQSNIS